MENNIKALIAHFILVVASFILLLIIFFVTGQIIWKYIIHIAIRVPLAIVLMLSYVYVGTLLDTKMDKKYHFLAGSLIAVIGLGLWLYTFSITREKVNILPEEFIDEYWIPFYLYYMPILMSCFLLGIPFRSLTFFANFIPSLLIGIGLSYKRLKMQRK
ncbi:hypothetical protein [Thermosediminibacter oceani]|uniref:Uncharacterized protein n=1 Tax=Thermosediminibacter oceani (strain ATCC BAA-1034 / DSM 16646 / JW/IW-1228P) TaxID=555079 RepID=D9RZZ9_THEOJ|nr:hypothetical protein [Thermosediminibacter oceani]ADL08776.1 conserved hypothetical protein [Thermosediminibacter oceani DSM 16646]